MSWMFQRIRQTWQKQQHLLNEKLWALCSCTVSTKKNVNSCGRLVLYLFCLVEFALGLHPFPWPPFNSRLRNGWSLFQLSLSERLETIWTGHQSITGLFMLTFTPTGKKNYNYQLNQLVPWEKAALPRENVHRHRKKHAGLCQEHKQLCWPSTVWPVASNFIAPLTLMSSAL